jgi:predicted lipoprotein with Yx(FWY)xxD motif
MAIFRLLAASGAVIAAGLSGCASDHHSGDMMPANYTASGSYMRSTEAGPVLTTPEGRTVYTFDEDTAGASSCYGDCAEEWPPVSAADDAQPFGHMSVVTRTDGTRQWAYDGKPLYLYHDDDAPGDVEGDGEGGVWHVVK